MDELVEKRCLFIVRYYKIVGLLEECIILIIILIFKHSQLDIL